MEEKISAALVSFDWDDYGLDDTGELAREDPHAEVFSRLAAYIAQALA